MARIEANACMVSATFFLCAFCAWPNVPFRDPIQKWNFRLLLRPPPLSQVFANRELNTVSLLSWANELVGRVILRKGFARFLWRLEERTMEGGEGRHEMEPAKFEEILDEIGVTIPLPEPPSSTLVDESSDSGTPTAVETEPPRDGDDGPRGDGVDLLVIMRLPLEADAETRENLSLARQAAFSDSGSDRSGLRAVFEFDHAGAPYGLPERVMALSHKIGVFSPAARWRLGGLFCLHNNGTDAASSMILEYAKKSKTFCIEALGQTAPDIQALQFVISAVFHVARDFPGASWTGWVECKMRHDGQKMYHLATSHEKQVRITHSTAEVCRVNRCGVHTLQERVAQFVLSFSVLRTSRSSLLLC